MFQSQTDAEKIFKFIAIAHFDSLKLELIKESRSIKKEDQLFVHKREQFMKRIYTLQKMFVSSHKIFNPEFEFYGQPF